MRVALFGGSFNPPHVAHQLVALYVLETAAIDELWFVPAFLHPFDKPLAPYPDRFAMCTRAAAALGPRARVSDIEERLGGPSRTLRTVQRLGADHPDTAFSLVIGSDLAGETSSWYGAAELRRLLPFIVIERAGRTAEPLSLGEVPPPPFGEAPPPVLVPRPPTPPGARVVMPEVSSTEIRAALHAGRAAEVARWVPKDVLDYIVHRGLYGSRQTP